MLLYSSVILLRIFFSWKFLSRAVFYKYIKTNHTIFVNDLVKLQIWYFITWFFLEDIKNTVRRFISCILNNRVSVIIVIKKKPKIEAKLLVKHKIKFNTCTINSLF